MEKEVTEEQQKVWDRLKHGISSDVQFRTTQISGNGRQTKFAVMPMPWKLLDIEVRIPGKTGELLQLNKDYIIVPSGNILFTDPPESGVDNIFVGMLVNEQ